MNRINLSWKFIIFLIFLLIPAVSCQQPKLPDENETDNTSLQTVYEIPQGTEPQRAETYDDIVYCGGRITAYRANCPYVVHTNPDEGWPTAVPGPDFIKEAEVTLSDCQFATSVTYRDRIETKAGEIRYNILYVELQTGSENADELMLIARQTGKPIANYEIKLRGTSPQIRVNKVGELNSNFGGLYLGHKLFYLMIEISPQVKAGDYTLYFILDDNGQICSELPCVIHVTE